MKANLTDKKQRFSLRQRQFDLSPSFELAQDIRQNPFSLSLPKGEGRTSAP